MSVTARQGQVCNIVLSLAFVFFRKRLQLTVLLWKYCSFFAVACAVWRLRILIEKTRMHWTQLNSETTLSSIQSSVSYIMVQQFIYSMTIPRLNCMFALQARYVHFLKLKNKPYIFSINLLTLQSSCYTSRAITGLLEQSMSRTDDLKIWEEFVSAYI